MSLLVNLLVFIFSCFSHCNADISPAIVWCSHFFFLGYLSALLKRQGINVKGLLKAEPVKEEPQPYIDCTGNLQVKFLKQSKIGSSFVSR